MKNTILQMLDDIDDIRENLKIWVVNKEIPLDERWEVFIESELGEARPFIVRFDSLGEGFVCYDGKIHIERYDVIDVSEIVEGLMDNDPSLIEAFKEEVLEKFVRTFKYDW
ncbi:MAG: hypothetical protein GY810_01210 [Aureispira sp.]|nr:hypothetical protein [Aureispira sp.]